MERLPEDAVEQRARGAGLVGGAHLAENLGLPGHHRVEARRDAEQVKSRRLVGQAVEEREHLLTIEAALRHERARTPLFSLGSRAVGEVELRAVAGREADGLAVARQVARQVARLVRGHRHELAHLDRSAVVRDADEDESHPAKCVAGSATRTRTTRPKPRSASIAARRPRQSAVTRSSR